MEIKVPFFDLGASTAKLKKEFLDSLSQHLDTNDFILGGAVQEFEQEFANYLGDETKSVVGVSNGLEGLALLLHAYSIGRGDEVIVPAHTFIATWAAVERVGAKIIPVDVVLETGLMDLEKVENALSKKTKAIMPVHLYGQVVDVEELRKKINKHIIIIEDAAQAHGAELWGEKAGTLGDGAAFSFYPSKNLGALGDAGAVVVGEEEAERIKKMRNYGSTVKYQHDERVFNSRMDSLQAGFLLRKLLYLDEWNEERRKAANYYLSRLRETDSLKLPSVVGEEKSHVWHLFTVRHRNRERLQAYLLEKGIQTGVHYPKPPYLQRCFTYLNYKKGDFLVAEQISDETLSLPLFPGIKEDQQKKVVEAIEKFLDEE